MKLNPFSNRKLSRRRALQTLFCSSAALAMNVRPQKVLAADDEAQSEFILLGDFGSNQSPQFAVAKGLKKYVLDHSIKPEALLLLGDNFYGAMKGGLASTRWKIGFEDLYSKDVFDCPCPAVLGNHDYHDNLGGEKVQLAYAKQDGTRWYMPSKWYRMEMGGKDKRITFLFIDTNTPKLSGAPSAKDKLKKPKPSMTKAEEEEQWAWLKAELAKPRGDFTIVVGHHPIYSNGLHGDSKDLVTKLAPLLEEHNVHAYICGHDHDMQHLQMEKSKTSFLLSGGGGARVRELKNKDRKQPYGLPTYGFSRLSLYADKLIFRHIDANGKLIHQFEKGLDFSWKV
jgi:tartrate-resistant acid phosphatase type 5